MNNKFSAEFLREFRKNFPVKKKENNETFTNRTPMNAIPTIKEKLEQPPKIVVTKTSPKEGILGTILSNTDGMYSYLFDAVLGGILMFIVTSSPVESIFNKIFTGFYSNVNTGYYGNAQGSSVIKMEKSISTKGNLIRIVTFIVLYVIIKTYVIVDGN